MNSVFRKLTWLARRRQREDGLREELEFHLTEEAEELQSNGLASTEARQAARRGLGNVTLVQEDTRAAWTWRIWGQLLQDLRYALRTMIKAPAFTTLAALSLALGIGANSAIFSFMDSILLRPLPVRDPHSLTVLNWHALDPRGGNPKNERTPFVVRTVDGSSWDDAKSGMTSGIFPYPAFELVRNNSSPVFSSVFGYYPTFGMNVMVKGQAELAHGEYVSGDFFGGLAVPLAAGRPIAAADDRAGAPPVAVLGSAFSRKRFDDPPAAVGQSILINNVAFTVTGVMPPGFFGVDSATTPDFYVPIHANLLLDTGPWGSKPEKYLDPNYYWIEVMGRLRPGVSLAQAQAALAPLFHRWVEGTATNEERANLPALTLKEGAGGVSTLRRQYSQPVFLLLTLVGLILAIACANTANLLLARAAARKREIAVRLSIGAGLWRVIRQLLTESLLLASLSGALGVLFGLWGVRFLTLLLANGQDDFTLHAELNWHVLGATFALSLVCGALFGLAPALQSARAGVMPALKETRAGESRTRARYAFLGLNLGHSLVVSQIALSLLLPVAAGLFMRTLSNLESIPLGFNRDNVLLFTLDAHQAGHRDPEIAGFYAGLRRLFAAIPGVRNATLAHSSLIGAGRGLQVSISGRDISDRTRILDTGPGFFSTMQIPLLLGREIDERDQQGSHGVVVVNELFAKANIGNANPLGSLVTLGGPHPRDMEIVGVAANAHYGDLKSEVPPVAFIPYNQGDYPPVERMTFALRTAGDPLRYVGAAREIVHRADARSRHRGHLAIRRNRSGYQPGDRARAARRRFRHPGPGDRMRRALRHHVLHGRPAHQRDRDSNGARRARTRHGLDGVAQGFRTGGCGARNRRPGSVGHIEADRVFPFRAETQ